MLVHAVELAIAEVGEALHGLEVGEVALGVPIGRIVDLKIDGSSASRLERDPGVVGQELASHG